MNNIEIYYIRARWSVQCVPGWNFSWSLSESPITAAVRNMCTKPVEYRDGPARPMTQIHTLRLDALSRDAVATQERIVLMISRC